MNNDSPKLINVKAWTGNLSDIDSLTYSPDGRTIVDIIPQPGKLLSPTDGLNLDIDKDQFGIICFGNRYYVFIPDTASDNLIMYQYFDTDEATTELLFNTLIE